MKVSLIIPTLNEKENISKLIPQVCKFLPKGSEVIVVDDNSKDKTADEVRKLSKKYPVKVFVRYERGLSGAVIYGFDKAKNDYLGVMDADLSHPPETLPALINALNEADITVGSRYMPGGGVEEWPFVRRMISKGATLMARPLTRVKDPMSGFFFLRKAVIAGKDLKPKGYKILLEILVKGTYSKVTEVPFMFRNRNVGKSKMTLKTWRHYVEHLFSLYVYRWTK